MWTGSDVILSAPAIDAISNPFLSALLAIIVLTLVMTVAVMYATWYERKIVARMHQRLGPTRTGPFGLLQPLADTLKLVTKEDLRPASADVVAFDVGCRVLPDVGVEDIRAPAAFAPDRTVVRRLSMDRPRQLILEPFDGVVDVAIRVGKLKVRMRRFD